ncbi:MAG: hypothetical protein HGB11_01160 [Chlorobiales bacterium]|nr:hypothetical protein [Chlorobiales bacterium]
MEPITTALITSLVTYLSTHLVDKAFETAVDEFTKDGITKMKSLFHKDKKPTETLQRLQEKPESPGRQKAVEAAITEELEENPDAINVLKEIVKQIEAKSGGNTVIGSKSVNTGTIIGRDVHLGDKNA